MPASDVCDVSLILLLHFPENVPSIGFPPAQSCLTSELVWLQAFTFLHTHGPIFEEMFNSNCTVLNTWGTGQPCLFVFVFLQNNCQNIYSSCFRTNLCLSLLGRQREPKQSLVLNFVLFYIWKSASAPLPSVTIGMVKQADFFFFHVDINLGLKVVEGNGIVKKKKEEERRSVSLSINNMGTECGINIRIAVNMIYLSTENWRRQTNMPANTDNVARVPLWVHHS